MYACVSKSVRVCERRGVREWIATWFICIKKISSGKLCVCINSRGWVEDKVLPLPWFPVVWKESSRCCQMLLATWSYFFSLPELFPHLSFFCGCLRQLPVTGLVTDVLKVSGQDNRLSSWGILYDLKWYSWWNCSHTCAEWCYSFCIVQNRCVYQAKKKKGVSWK